MHIPPGSITLLPAGVNTRSRLAELLRFDELRAAHPGLELFVLVCRTVEPAFAVVMGLPMDVVHIQGRGWPLEIDPVKRLVVLYPPGKVPL